MGAITIWAVAEKSESKAEAKATDKSVRPTHAEARSNAACEGARSTRTAKRSILGIRSGKRLGVGSCDGQELPIFPQVRGKERFMSISISSSLSTASLAATNSSSTSAAARNPQPTINNSGDTVKLSESQQVYQLYNQGQAVSQIATTLSLPVEIVNNYLGIAATAG